MNFAPPGKSFRKAWRTVRDRLPLLYFLSSIAALVFAYGVAVGKYQVFPYSVLHEARIAAIQLGAWAELWQLDTHPHVIVSETNPSQSLARHDPGRAFPGFTFAEMYRPGGFSLVLLDMSGNVVHGWKLPADVYEAAEAKGWGLERDHYEIMGAHLYENGEVLATLAYRGLAKLDSCSRLLWFLPESNHHSVTVEDDGTIWSLSTKLVVEADQALPHFATPYEDHMLLRVTPDGKVAEAISILDALFAGSYQGIVLEGDQDYPASVTDDPTHANDIEIVDETFAGHNSFAAPGDIAVSLRSADSIVLIDRQSHAAKWALTGLFLRQHDLDLLPDGSISIFDNRTDKGQHNTAVRKTRPQSFGYSRIVRFDPLTQKVLWEYVGTREEPFYTSIEGDHQTLPNGNVLIVESEAGRMFEVDPRDNSIVWEWFNLLGGEEGDRVGRITRATRYPPDYPKFLSRACPAGTASPANGPGKEGTT